MSAFIVRRSGISTVVLLFLLACVVLTFWPSKSPLPKAWPETEKPHGSSSGSGSGSSNSISSSSSWAYQFSRDADNHALSKDQCDLAFPKLYKDIDSAAAARKDNRIQLHELDVPPDKCLVRVLIYNNEVRSRLHSVKHNH